MAKKPVDLQALSAELAEASERLSAVSDLLSTHTMNAVAMPSELAKQMQRTLVLVARDANDAAAKLYGAIRAAESREELATATTVKP